MFAAFRRSRRPDPGPVPTPVPAPVTAAAQRVAAWQRLDAESAGRLTRRTTDLVDRFRWEAAAGFDLTSDVVATIAAVAALLTLELPDDCLDAMGPVIVHATTIEIGGPHLVGDGLQSDDPVALDGESHHRGPVLLAWDAVVDELAHPRDGRNVVLHELAHQLDMVDGWVDGTPPLWGEERRRWIEVCSEALDRLQAGDSPLDPYGAQGPGEFFAVAVEAFFTRPVELRDAEPALYGVLADHLGQDPAARGVGDRY